MAAEASKQAPGCSAFISHAKADAKKASAIAEGLEKRGFKCWIAPRDVKAGRAYGDEIIRGIESAKAFVLLLSKASNDSAFVAREVERAVSKKKPLIAVRIADVQPGPTLELFVSSTQWIDAFPGRLAPHIDRLADLLADESGTELAPHAGGTPPRPLPRWPWPAAAAVALLLGLGVWQWQRGGVDQDGRLQTDFYACANLAPDLAIPACDRAIGSGSYAGMELAGLYNDRGNAHMDKGELDMALADLDEAIRLNPRNFVAFWNRAAVYAAKNDFERARSDFTNALALNPDETSKQKIVEALNAVAVNPSAKAASDDPLVITTPTWASPGSDSSAAEASVPALTYPPAALPASPPMATIPAFPASPSPMPAR